MIWHQTPKNVKRHNKYKCLHRCELSSGPYSEVTKSGLQPTTGMLRLQTHQLPPSCCSTNVTSYHQHAAVTKLPTTTNMPRCVFHKAVAFGKKLSEWYFLHIIRIQRGWRWFTPVYMTCRSYLWRSELVKIKKIVYQSICHGSSDEVAIDFLQIGSLKKTWKKMKSLLYIKQT